MALTKMNDDLAIIAKLDDEPNDVGGLTAAQLKAKFDEAGETIRRYINDTLLPQLESGEGAAGMGAVMDGETTTVQGALDLLRAASLKSGNLPVDGHEGQLLQKLSDEPYDSAWVDVLTKVSFQEIEWAAPAQEGGDYTLTIAQNVHKRAGDGFGCYLRHTEDGVDLGNTWAVLGSKVSYDARTGNILLTGADPFTGSALFYG